MIHHLREVDGLRRAAILRVLRGLTRWRRLRSAWLRRRVTLHGARIWTARRSVGRPFAKMCLLDEQVLGGLAGLQRSFKPCGTRAAAAPDIAA
jgi:hypothetical protein